MAVWMGQMYSQLILGTIIRANACPSLHSLNRNASLISRDMMTERGKGS